MISAIANILKTTTESRGDRIRFGLFAIVGLLAVYIGFFHYSALDSVMLMKRNGYYFMLVLVLCFSAVVFHAVRQNYTELASWMKASYRWPFFVALSLLTLYLWASQEIGFKVLMDEINLLGTSMRLHFDNVAMSPIRGYEINGVFLPLDDGFVDKRPLLYPFLISLLHDATGYRPENGIYLNLCLIPLTLILAYTLGVLVSNRLGGLLAMILMACFPMFSMCLHGGGFEGLNLFLILALMLTAFLYLRNPEPVTLSLLCLTVVLLSNVRYESVLFVAPVAIVILLGYLRVEKLIFSAGLYVTPILMLPVPLLHRVFDLDPVHSWQLVSKDADTAFSMDYLPRNMVQAMAMFFDRTHQQPVSFYLTCFGIAGCILFLILLLRETRKPGPITPILVALVATCVGVVGLLAVLLFYFWDFDDVVTRRLALPIVFLMVFPGVAALGGLFKSPVVMRVAIALALLVLLVEVVPRNAKDMYTQEYIPGQVLQWQREFIEDHKGEYNLIIDRPGFWVTHQVPGLRRNEALKKKGLLKFHLLNQTFDNIFVVETYNKDIIQGVLRGGVDARIDEDFITEIVAEKTFNGVTLVRIVRVKDIDVDVPDTLLTHIEDLDVAEFNRDELMRYQLIQQARLSDLLP
ncbi:hypothetical protein [Cerasicoccus maritimus]|uniref:hypothetical protein n=1 Tax=Cerasicoccus maritimus TaxID=490089 RepID=UPI0028526BA3|nr:hypothetical protein [Cerasicoccus maritimus]